MFDRLFHKARVRARHENGPLAEERRRFLAHCAEQQMSAGTLQNIASYTLLVANVLRLADRSGELITKDEVKAEAERRAHRQPKPQRKRPLPCARRNFRGHAIRWLTFLGRLQPCATVQQPYAKQIAQFTDFQLRERGLSSQTVVHHSRTIQRLLKRIEEAGFRLKTLNIVEMDALLTKLIREGKYARNTIHGWVSILRTFCRFAERRGWCRQGLATALMAPRIYLHESLPVGPSWEDVQRLLALTERGRPVDVRDRALLMLLVVYGVRAGEATALRLQDFDWESEKLSVPHGKSQRPRIYPLCRSVGDAVLRYVRQVRPLSPHREVFLTMLAPFRPLTANGLGAIVRGRFQALGLHLPHYGPHMLRHACATRLVAQGLSLKEIGDHLGHVGPDSTRIYAKVDLVALRAVADFSLEDLL